MTTALAVVEAALDAAERLDPVLHFLDELDAAGARAAAERLEPTGALAGVPFLIKSRTPADAPIIARLVTALADLFAEVDALVTPTTLTVAHGYDQHEETIVTGDPCWVFNVTGHPAVSVPVGLVDGLPVGAQVVAPHGADEVALAVARQLLTELPLPPVR